VLSGICDESTGTSALNVGVRRTTPPFRTVRMFAVNNDAAELPPSNFSGGLHSEPCTRKVDSQPSSDSNDATRRGTGRRRSSTERPQNLKMLDNSSGGKRRGHLQMPTPHQYKDNSPSFPAYTEILAKGTTLLARLTRDDGRDCPAPVPHAHNARNLHSTCA
jgi:hypothetical protein